MSYTLQQLRHFVAVAETGSVSRAAERCHISQPSLSSSLKNLGDSLASNLVTRHRNGVALTTDGERFLRHAQQILAAVDKATMDMLQSPRHLKGTLSIGVTETISGALVPLILMEGRRQFPEVNVEIIEDERPGVEQALMDGRIDFAVLLVSNIEATPGISVRPMLKSARKLWTSVEHPLLTQATISLRDVAEHGYILLDRDEHIQTALKYWNRYALTPRVILRTKSTEAIRSLVSEGFGVTILSDLTYREWSHEGGRIARRSLVEAIPSMDVGVAYRRGETLTPIAQAFSDFLRTLMRTQASKLS